MEVIMFYGDDIIFQKEGVRVPRKALQPIGITDGSRCWGVWVPAISEEKFKKPPHLLVASFPPESWPVLFNVTIKLNDSVGTMTKAAQVLENENFNILSTQCAPSGHQHATWNIIGEALNLKQKVNNLTYPEIPYDRDISNDPDVLDFVSKKFSPMMFEYSIMLKKALEEKNRKLQKRGQGFLHKRFVRYQTLLYDRTLIDQRLIKELKGEILESVKCSWLQNMAAFWLYGKRQKQSILFKYDAEESLLKPDDAYLEDFTETINEYIEIEKLPIKSIASFDQDEHYVRIILEETDERKIIIKVRYKANLRKDSERGASSKGFLRRVTEKLSNEEINLNLHYICNTTIDRTDYSEDGIISLIGAPIAPQNKKKKMIDIDKIKYGLMDIKHPCIRIDIRNVDVGYVGVKKLFISTKFDWIKEDKPQLLELLCIMIRKFGFLPITGDVEKRDLLEEGLSKPKTLDIAEKVTEKIKTSSAFLLLLPRLENSSNKFNEQLEWVNYELGVARGSGTPCALCVDASRKDYEDWTNIMKVTKGWRKFPFHQNKDNKAILQEIKPALEWLVDIVYK